MTAKTRPPERDEGAQKRDYRKVSKRTVLATGVATAALVVGTTAALAAGFLGHKVEDGDTLSQIAAEYGTTVDALVELNNISNPDLIVVDDELIIRPLAEGEIASLTKNVHTVEAGDTLTSIAAKLGVTVEEIAAANGIANPDLIVTGDLLVVPSADDADATAEAPAGPPVATPAAQPEAEPTEEGDAEETATAEPVDSEDGEDEDAGTDPVLVTNEIQPQTPANAVQAGSATLHLVMPGETVESIAATYGVTPAQLLAANGHARNGISGGMILKVPPADSASVQLVGMPTALETSAVASELTAVSVATAYWGSSISEATLYEMLELSDNPHLGFRGDINGAFGGTDDYGVYAAPLSIAVAQKGFVGEEFYADGDASELTARIDQGIPVVAWITYGTAVAEPQRVDDGVRPFTLVPGKQAVVVYGYDDAGVLIVDVANGGYAHVNWDDFMRSWNYFDGMGLAISPI